jgi:hypothetical protein
MQIFLRIVGVGLISLGVLAAATILLFPVFGIVLRGPESSLLLLSALCSFGGFLAFVLRSRRVRIDLESERAHSDPKPEREDSESKQARRDLETKKAERLDTLLNITGGALLLLGLTSAIVIFLTKTGFESWFPARSTGSLWLMFVLSTLLGQVAVLLAQSEVASQTTLKKKQFWDESCGTTRQTRTHRRRARFVWRF